MKASIFPFLALTLAFVICAGASGEVIEIFEDDQTFMDKLTNQDTATTIENTDDDSFYGDISVKLGAPATVSNGQRYSPNIPGWTYNVVKDPSAENEVRWIMFAWKKLEGEGIMIQFPSSGSWGVQPQGGRYFAGVNKTGWAGIQVADEAPREWEVVIRDLYDDFGAFTMTGMALTQYDNIGLYDSIYLAWSEDELKRLLTEMTPVEPRSKLAATWGKVKSGDFTSRESDF
jgi:hypothetical protein